MPGKKKLVGKKKGPGTPKKKVVRKKSASSKYVKDEEKRYFLDNYKSIDFFKGNFNEIVFIKKNKISN